MTIWRPAAEWPHYRALEASAVRPAAGGRGTVLEISSQSSEGLGRRLSAMNLVDPLSGKPVEVEYQASKDYGRGRSAEIERMTSGFAAKRAANERRRAERGNALRGFELAERFDDVTGRFETCWWPAETGSAAYDYLWCRAALDALGAADEARRRLERYAAFSDRFHHTGAVACQAKSAAILTSLLTAAEGPGTTALDSPHNWLAWRMPQNEAAGGATAQGAGRST